MIKPKKSKGLSNLIIRTMLVLASLFIVAFAAMYNSRIDARKLSYQYMEDTAGLYVEMVENDISSITNKLVLMLLKENTEIMDLPPIMVPTQSTYYCFIEDLIAVNKNLKLQYKGYYFYEYHEESDFLIFDTGPYFSNSEKSELVNNLSNHIKEKMHIAGIEPLWSYFEAEGEKYLCSLNKKNGAAVGSIVNIDDILDDLNIVNLEYKAIPFMIDKENNQIITPIDVEFDWKEIVTHNQNENTYLFHDTVLSYNISKIGQIYLLVFPSKGLLARIFNQIELWILLISMAAFAFVGLYNYFRVLRPVNHFLEILQDPDEEVWLNDQNINGILEFEMVSNQFKSLVQRIKSHKIVAYERELKHKEIQLEFVHEQFKPHFFLNCISIIHAMAERIQANNIVEVSEKLSKHMRGAISNSFAKQKVEKELERIQSYIDIQQIRYGDAFTYEVITEDNVEQCLIPAFILHVFVENAIQHGVIADSYIDITLYITKEHIGEKDFLYITLTDTGKGFSNDVLKALENGDGIIYNGREHIGIKNTMNRIKLFYGNTAKLELFNMNEKCGAVVALTLPLDESI